MIQEYRKQSAEWLGKTLTEGIDNSKIWILDENLLPEHRWRLEWHPDKDANQREMIEDRLDRQGCILYYDNEDFHTWTIVPMITGGVKFICYDKSKSIAFMKAFMEFLKQES